MVVQVIQVEKYKEETHNLVVELLQVMLITVQFHKLYHKVLSQVKQIKVVVVHLLLVVVKE